MKQDGITMNIVVLIVAMFSAQHRLSSVVCIRLVRDL